MSRIFEISDKYVDELASLDPTLATALGIPGHEREMPDFSPAGIGAIAELNRRTSAALRDASEEGEPDRIAREVMLERLGVSLEMYEAGEHLRNVRILSSPLQRARDVFDQMPRSTAEEWSNIAARLALVPRTLAGYRETLRAGAGQGKVAAKRQVREAAKQARVYSEPGGFFDGLLASFRQSGVSAGGLGPDMEEGVRAAKGGYAEMVRFFEEYLPRASEREGSGPERYELMARVFLGESIRPEETYAWGWEELYRIEAEMRETAERIKPGASVAEACEILETDPARSVDGVEAYRAWLQELHDEALRELHGRHFDIPQEIRRMEVMIPPPGGSLAAYYTGPSEDFSRPGRTWWPTGGRSRFPKWGEVSTVYHEGVPGHHLQVAMVRYLKDDLSRYQRAVTFISGHGEGWALYAERLMGELGYLEDADAYMGMLSAHALRAVRVIIDIGMHLELRIPEGERFHPGEVWNHDLALDFAVERSLRPRDFMASEVVRYLGWPAQAISYKVGERGWLAARASARAKDGAAFDLKAFHTQALSLGPMGLSQLQRELGA